MAKNLLPIIAKGLGVEIGEEFKLKLFNGDIWKNHDFKQLVFKFCNSGIKYRVEDTDKWYDLPVGNVGTIVCGDYEAIKLPYEPKEGESYWTYDLFSTDFKPYAGCWGDCTKDYLRKNCGCVFRTEAEAIAARPAKYKELTGKEWGEGEAM